MSSSTLSSADRFYVVIPCAGFGSRAGTPLPKQYQTIAGLPMVVHTLNAFASVTRLSRGVLVVAPADGHMDDVLKTYPQPLFAAVRKGGATRADSVGAGLRELLISGASETDWVLVHDAARCMVTSEQINALIDACHTDAVGGLLAHKLADTLKCETQEGRVAHTVDRADKWLAQTPQMFRLGPLLNALAHAGDAVTDESSAMELMGQSPRLVAGNAQNFKVTYPEDFALAEAIFNSRLERRAMNAPSFRIGEGWDVHALVEGRPLMLGGVHVPHTHGLLGHSDADVLLHAVTDALLGAAALGDIGRHFSDTDAAYKNADSWVLLQQTATLVRKAGFQIGNVDCTVVAQAPKLASFMPAMCQRIAQALDVDVSRVNVKAKTAEKIGPVGQGQSMEARAVALIY